MNSDIINHNYSLDSDVDDFFFLLSYFLLQILSYISIANLRWLIFLFPFKDLIHFYIYFLSQFFLPSSRL